MAGDSQLMTRLAGIVGERHVLTDPEITAGYVTDWTGRFTGKACCVVRPADPAEVSAVLAACHGVGVPVVPQGGNTGLVGGAVPHDGAVLLSLRRLQRLDPVDVATATVLAGAGVTLADLQRHATAAGFAFGIDLAARDSATVGGMIATNAGGIHVLRYGRMQAQLRGVEAVLANGAVIGSLDGSKATAGYDLDRLVAGSEGTIAVVTGARLRLVPALRSRVVALAGVADLDAAVNLLARLRALTSLEAVEFFEPSGLDVVLTHSGLRPPLASRHGAYVLVECAAHTDPTEALADVLAAGGVSDAAIGTDPATRSSLWAYRERHTEAINALGVPHKLDVAVPTGRLPRFCAEVHAAVTGRWPGATVVLFGHLAEGTVHVNIVGPDPDDTAVDDAVLELCVAAGGSISAEHGIGVTKRAWLTRVRSTGDLAAMTAVKAALDPVGLLNPGVLLPDDREG